MSKEINDYPNTQLESIKEINDYPRTQLESIKEINDYPNTQLESLSENLDLIESTKVQIPSLDDISKLADFFKVMGDSTRLQILIALIHNEFCVSDLSKILNMSQSATSHQLKALKNAKLVKARRQGKSIYYSLDDDHIEDIVAESLVHVIDCSESQ